jgi:hypothetical protein
MIEEAVIGTVIILFLGLITVLLDTSSNPNPNMNCAYRDGNNSAQSAELHNRTETSGELTCSCDWEKRSISVSAVFRRTAESRQIAKN